MFYLGNGRWFTLLITLRFYFSDNQKLSSMFYFFQDEEWIGKANNDTLVLYLKSWEIILNTYVLINSPDNLQKHNG